VSSEWTLDGSRMDLLTLVSLAWRGVAWRGVSWLGFEQKPIDVQPSPRTFDDNGWTGDDIPLSKP